MFYHEFSYSVQPKPIIETAKKGISATNPAVRTAAITLVGTLFLFMGPPLRSFFDGEKPALAQQLNAEFDKVCFQNVYIVYLGTFDFDWHAIYIYHFILNLLIFID